MTTLEAELIAEVERLQDELETTLTLLERTQREKKELLRELESLTSKYQDLETSYNRSLENLQIQLESELKQL